jgi:sensor histidine kinase YesM
MRWIAIFLMFSVATAATLDNNGNLLLSKQEVDNTRELFNELNRVIQYQDHRIEELEKGLLDVEKRKCL